MAVLAPFQQVRIIILIIVLMEALALAALGLTAGGIVAVITAAGMAVNRWDDATRRS